MLPLLSLSRLSVVSECPFQPYLRLLLSAAINVEHLVTGTNAGATDMDDAALAGVIADNRMARLKTVKVMSC